MSQVLAAPPALTPTNLREHLGLDAERVRLVPFPATEADLLALTEGAFGVRCELIAGVVVEKPVGIRQSAVAAEISRHIGNYALPRRLGLLTGEQGATRTHSGQVRAPDVAFTTFARLRAAGVPVETVLPIAPDWVVEVLSPANTAAEMEHKRAEYFAAGTRWYWEVDLELCCVTVWSAVSTFRVLHGAEELDGGVVLPGLRFGGADVFAPLDALAEWGERSRD
jgi:Uma2 family endonuclease